MRSRLGAVVITSVLVAALVMGAPAGAAPGGGPNHWDDTYVDPTLSELCGFTVIVHDVGVFKTKTNRSGAFILQQNLRETLTNADAGTSVVMSVGGRAVFRDTANADGTITTTLTFSGLDYKLRTDSGNIVSAGHATLTATFTFDEFGNVVDVELLSDNATQQLAHIVDPETNELTPNGVALCQALAA